VEIPARLSELMPREDPWWSRWPAHLIRRFVAEIAADATVGPTFTDGVRAQELLEAVLVSMRERRWVDVAIEGSDTESG
jgi:predicted dehydrogenase